MKFETVYTDNDDRNASKIGGARKAEEHVRRINCTSSV
jgi:hypothetical protein